MVTIINPTAIVVGRIVKQSPAELEEESVFSQENDAWEGGLLIELRR